MPKEGLPLISHHDILRYEEILKITRCISNLGIENIKLTGGEPLVRKGVLDFSRELLKIPGIKNISMTSNGILIPENKDKLKNSGIDSINISLDTLNSVKYAEITRGGELAKVLDAIEVCLDLGIAVKLNCVAICGFNDDEICSIAHLAKDKDLQVRFIELMPMGSAEGYKYLSAEHILSAIKVRYGRLSDHKKREGHGPAVYYKPAGFVGSIGIIHAVSRCFCSSCNRVRLTSDGFLKLCLHYDTGVDLKSLVRAQTPDDELTEVMRKYIYDKPRQHSFSSENKRNDIECKGMSQIGG
jgi:cyclic pyranopterin phosphate synthase